MTSQINYTAIDTAYPVAGQDNDTQGFRDNFAATKTALQYANSEITNLQTNSALTVDDLAALKALTTRPESVIVKTGQAAGTWRWEAGSSTTADDGIVVQCTSGTAGRYKRIYSGPVNTKWFGAKGDGSTVDTTALQNALNTGKNVNLAAGTHIVDGPLSMVTPSQVFEGEGPESKLKLVLASGSPACAVIWIKPAAHHAEVCHLTIDGNDTSYIAPLGGASIGYGDAIIIEADDVAVYEIDLENCWNNGVGIGKFLSGNTGQVNYYPERAIVSDIRGRNNGYGIGTGGGGGATVNNLTGSKAIVDNVSDIESALAVTEDYAGGASGLYSNISGTANGTGLSYIGSGDSVWINLRSFYSFGFDVWVDAYASGVTISGFEFKASRDESFLLKGCNGVKISNGRITSCGFNRDSGTAAAAILIDTTPNNMTEIYIDNVDMDLAVGASLTCDYGIKRIGANTVSGRVSVGSYDGLSGVLYDLGSGLKVSGVPTYVTQNQGNDSITAATTKTVAHGLAYAPDKADIIIQPTSDVGSGIRYWVSAADGTNFTLTTSGAATFTFGWLAKIAGA